MLKSCKFRRVLRLKLPLDELPTTLRVKAAEEVSSNVIVIIWEQKAKTIKSSPKPPTLSHKIPQQNMSNFTCFLPGFRKSLPLFTLKPRSLYQPNVKEEMNFARQY